MCSGTDLASSVSAPTENIYTKQSMYNRLIAIGSIIAISYASIDATMHVTKINLHGGINACMHACMHENWRPI